MRCGGKIRISFAAASAFCDEKFFAVLENLADHFTGLEIFHHCPRRDRHHDRCAAAPALVRAHPVLATLGGPRIAVGIVEQRGEVRITANGNVATFATFSAIGAAHRFAPLAAE